MSSQNVFVTPSASSSRFIGRVKWFNNKAGYGFITVTDGVRSGSDIFVHHSAVSVENQQYKYLVQGEYVEFSEIEATSGPHHYQASNVLGVKGGKLMCETRRDFKIARSNYKSVKTGSDSHDDSLESVEVRQKSVVREAVTPRVRGEGPREGSKKEWTLVQKDSDKPKRVSRTPRKTSSTVATNESK